MEQALEEREEKRISILIRKTPFNTARNSEALRMGLGLTLRDDRVQLLFVEDGVYSLIEAHPELIGSPGLRRHLETLQELDCPLIAEKESLDQRRLNPPPPPIEVRSRQEVALLLAQSDIVISY
ncbi:MAG: DsrE family protein [Candidatus Tectomicrobia bacterium]|uniref:DsrE family protein n=1 Tax=Tectimicrobiota bacterium TaxID=2528274 RepID=A0A932FX90_UNCTE|nr:DsrE family protein [Candidatus Tectomicrobia bacterium]